MIEVWYFGTLCVPFVEVLLSTWIESVRMRMKKEEERGAISSKTIRVYPEKGNREETVAR